MNKQSLRVFLIFTSPLVFSSFNVSGGITHSFKTFGDCDAATNSNDSFAAAYAAPSLAPPLLKCTHSGSSGGSLNVGLYLKRIQLSFNIYSPRNITATIDGIGEYLSIPMSEMLITTENQVATVGIEQAIAGSSDIISPSEIFITASPGETASASSPVDSNSLVTLVLVAPTLLPSPALSLNETTSYGFNIGYPLSDHLVLGAGYTVVGLNFKALNPNVSKENHDEGTSLFSGFITISSSINDTFTTYATANLGYGEIEKKAGTIFDLTDFYLLSRNITFGISYNRDGIRETPSP